MVLRRGFKTEANNHSRDLRKELNLKPHQPLCPWKLAEWLEIPVVAFSEFSDTLPIETAYLTQKDQTALSAVTVFYGSRRLIAHNDSHSRKRQASNIAHELSHGILGHPPTEPLSDNGCRNFNKEIEEEANWLGPTLLISEEAALYIVKCQMSIDEASNAYGVTKDVIRMRLNVTGAEKRIARMSHVH